jgi:hypothetical protein
MIHHEGAASRTNVEIGAKSYQRINQPKFQLRWSERLAAHPRPRQKPVRLVHPHGVNKASRGLVLVIDHRELTPDRDCGSLRMFEIIRAILQRGHHVTFIPADLTVSEHYAEELRRIGAEVIHKPNYASVAEFLDEAGEAFSLAIISRAVIAARYMTMVRRLAPRAKVVYDTVDLQFLREERQANLGTDEELTADVSRRKKQELSLVMRADLTLVVSPVEKAILEAECYHPEIKIIPTIYPVPDIGQPDFSGRRDIVFIGGFLRDQDHSHDLPGSRHRPTRLFRAPRHRLHRRISARSQRRCRSLLRARDLSADPSAHDRCRIPCRRTGSD